MIKKLLVLLIVLATAWVGLLAIAELLPTGCLTTLSITRFPSVTSTTRLRRPAP